MPIPTILQPSFMSLLLQMRAGGQVIGSGTGFIVNSTTGYLLITNWHNLTGRRPDTDQPISPNGSVPDEVVIHHNGTQLGNWLPRLEPLYKPGGQPRWIEHPTLGQRVDVVALPLTDTANTAIYPHSLGGGPDIAWGPAEPISVLGFPFGVTAGGYLAIWATGFVASEPALDWNGLPVFLVDCRARPGQSGSAVIVHRDGAAARMKSGAISMKTGPIWNFVGIYSGRINDQSDLGIVWKSEAIQAVVDAAQTLAVAPTPPTDSQGTQGDPDEGCACGSGLEFSRCHGDPERGG